jgi:hypothetical protein
LGKHAVDGLAQIGSAVMDRQNDGHSDAIVLPVGAVQLAGGSRLGAQVVLPRLPQW